MSRIGEKPVCVNDVAEAGVIRAPCDPPAHPALTGELESGLFGVFSSPVYRAEAVRHYFQHRYESVPLRNRLPRRLWFVVAVSAAVVILLAGASQVPLVRSVPLIVCPSLPSGRAHLFLALALGGPVPSNAGRARLFDGGSVFRVRAVQQPIRANLAGAAAACRASNGQALPSHTRPSPLDIVLVGAGMPRAGRAILQVAAGRLGWFVFQESTHGGAR